MANKRFQQYFLLAAASLWLAGCATAPPPPAVPAPDVAAGDPRLPLPPLRIVATGDIMLGTDFPTDRLPPDDGRGLLQPVVDVLRSGDITFGNVEGVLMDGGTPEKFCNNPSLCYLFRSPARYAETLAWAGFDIAGLANNHARDFGEAGRNASMAALTSAGIAHTGREGDIASLEYRGMRVAVVAFAPNPGSWPLLDINAARYLVQGLAAGHDRVIVSFHGGGEGEDAVHVTPGMETFHGEARGDLVAFSHAVIDAGADLVIGHGPHVPRALELYRNRLIAYSLGNFATHWGISVSGRKGLAPILDVTLDENGRFVEGRIVSAIQQRPVGVLPDPASRAFRLMKELTREDRNGGGLIFFDDGRLLPAPQSASDPPPISPPISPSISR